MADSSQTNNPELVITDEQGNDHVFPAGTQPAQALAAMKANSNTIYRAAEHITGISPLTTKDWLKQKLVGAVRAGVEALPALGATIGGIGGTAAGGPAGGLALAGLGGEAGESSKQLLQRYAPQFYGQPPQTSAEALKGIAVQGTLGMGQELGGRALGVIGETALPQRMSGIRSLEQSTGVQLHPGQEVAGGALKTLGKFAEGGEAGQSYIRQQAGQFIGRMNSLRDSLGLVKTDATNVVEPIYKQIDDMVGKRIYTPIETGAIPDPTTGLYQPYLIPESYSKVGGKLVPTTKEIDPVPVAIGDIRDKLLEKFKNFASVTIDKKIVPGSPESKAVQLVQDIRNWPDKMNFGEAQEARSLAMDIARNQTELFPGRGKAIAASLAKDLNSAMETAANNFKGDPQLWSNFRLAQDTWKASVQRENFSQFVNTALSPASKRDLPVDMIDAAKLDSAYRKMTPAEQDLAVPQQVRGQFENLLKVGKQTGVPKSATGTLMTFAQDAVFNALKSPAGRSLLSRGWTVPTGTAQSAAFMTRVVTTYAAESATGQQARQKVSNYLP